ANGGRGHARKTAATSIRQANRVGGNTFDDECGEVLVHDDTRRGLESQREYHHRRFIGHREGERCERLCRPRPIWNPRNRSTVAFFFAERVPSPQLGAECERVTVRSTAQERGV